MTELPDATSSRPLSSDDLDAVFAVLAAHQEALHGEVDVTASDLTSDWARPSFDATTDAVVVEQDGHVVGYLESFNGRLDGGVLPSAQGRGIGGWLLDWGIERARQSGLPSAELTGPDADVALAGLLQSRGFTPRWESWLFWRALNEESDAPRAAPVAAPVAPDGLLLRNIEADRDAPALYDLIDTAFNDWTVRDDRWTFEDWRARFLEHEDVEPKTSWVLEKPDGSLVGAALSLTDRGWGWLEQLAVRRQDRGRGLGTVLLHACFASYLEQGLHTAGLATESRTGARLLYERSGLVVQRSFTRWSLPLS